MRVYFIFCSLILLNSCSKERISGEFDENYQTSYDFTPTTTPINVLSNNIDVNECFYQNNFVKLIAFDPLIHSYQWFKCYDDQEDKMISKDSKGAERVSKFHTIMRANLEFDR